MARYQDAREMEEALAGCLAQLEQPQTGLLKGSAPWRLALLAAAAVAGLSLASLLIPVGDDSAALEAACFVEDVGGSAPRPFAPDRRLGPDERLFVEVQAEVPVHFYVLLEDLRGRKHLLYPLVESRALAPGRRHRVPASGGEPGESAWTLPAEGGGGWLLLLASRAPLEELADALPWDARTQSTGKRGFPRLKPTTLRALLRRLGALPEDARALDDDDSRALLAAAVGDFGSGESRLGAADGLWARRVRFVTR